jgi:YD repeat-containing protein
MRTGIVSNRLSTLVITALLAVAGCSGDASTAPLTPVPPIPPIPSVGLKDIVLSSLPSPYYHFEYDETSRISVVSFASGLTNYDVKYVGDRLTEMQNNIIVNHDRLTYTYDGAGRVSEVDYLDGNGVTFTRVHFTYAGTKLVGTERERLTATGFVVDKRMSFTYDADDNLFELTQHFSAIAGVQDDATTVDRYEQYDKGINVDGFSLLHNEFFDHLFLLPGVQLQKGNPRKESRSGDGLNYTVTYAYVYDATGRPVTKTGDGLILNGPNAGQRFPANSVFSYYN